MKSILYILIAVFSLTIIYNAIPQTGNQPTNAITLKTVDSNFSQNQLDASSKILKARLSDYGIIDAETLQDSKSGILTLRFNQPVSEQELSFLLLSKGSIDFYETYNNTDVIKAFQANTELSKLIDFKLGGNSDKYSSIVGFCKPENQQVVNKLIEQVSNEQGMSVKFLWSAVPYFEGQFVLHMLHKESSIDKSSIENTTVNQDERTGAYQLSITFNTDGAKLWSEITKNNIGKNITITLDDRVLSSPKVMAQINGGRAMITGNFSENDLKTISALANNENLPLEFTMVQ